MHQRTTKLNVITGNELKIEGKEVWDIHGSIIRYDDIKRIHTTCVGLKRRWDCIEKAMIARSVIGKGYVTFGTLEIWSEDMRSSYKFEFNPPFEVHAWVTLAAGPIPIIFDFGLAGAIEAGLDLKDDEGPVLVNRKPIIMNGTPPKWVVYRPMMGVLHTI